MTVEEIIKNATITPFTPQYDLYEEHEESCEKIICKDECGVLHQGEF